MSRGKRTRVESGRSCPTIRGVSLLMLVSLLVDLDSKLGGFICHSVVIGTLVASTSASVLRIGKRG